MKRFLSAVMATVFLTLTLSLGLTAMAEEQKYTGGFGMADVKYTYKVETKKLSTECEYYIDFGNLTFAYTKEYKQVPIDEAPYYRTEFVKEGWDHTSANIKVRNASEAGIMVFMEFNESGDTPYCTMSYGEETYVSVNDYTTATLTLNSSFKPTSGTEEGTVIGDVTVWVESAVKNN